MVFCVSYWFFMVFYCVLREKIELYYFLLVSLVFFYVFCWFCLRFVCFLREKKGRNNTLVCDGLNFFGFLCILSCILLDLPAFYVFFYEKTDEASRIAWFSLYFVCISLLLNTFSLFFARKITKMQNLIGFLIILCVFCWFCLRFCMLFERKKPNMHIAPIPLLLEFPLFFI